jgi:acetyl-CoA acetyltransferase
MGDSSGPGTASRSIRGRAVVAGIGHSEYYRQAQSPEPEFVLALHAIQTACADAGLDPHQLDGFVSFADDRNHAQRLAAAFGVSEWRWSTMQWGGGGGGGAGAIQQAAAAIACGFAERVVVYRSLAQGQYGRFGQHRPDNARADDPYLLPYGVLSPAHWIALRVNRFLHETGISPETQRAVALACSYHAQQNPDALMRGRPLSAAVYDQSRWIVEPFRLYDCCLENDAAAALVLVSPEAAADLPQPPVYVLGAAQGAEHRASALSYNGPHFASAGYRSVGRRLFDMAQVGPGDVDVVQSYENFTGAVVMSLMELGFCGPDDAEEVIRFENLIAPGGGLPLNTSGGNLAECYVHGLGLVMEAVRQIRGQSANQVPGAAVSLVATAPCVAPLGAVIFGAGSTL